MTDGGQISDAAVVIHTSQNGIFQIAQRIITPPVRNVGGRGGSIALLEKCIIHIGRLTGIMGQLVDGCQHNRAMLCIQIHSIIQRDLRKTGYKTDIVQIGKTGLHKFFGQAAGGIGGNHAGFRKEYGLAAGHGFALGNDLSLAGVLKSDRSSKRTDLIGGFHCLRQRRLTVGFVNLSRCSLRRNNHGEDQ